MLDLKPKFVKNDHATWFFKGQYFTYFLICLTVVWKPLIQCLG